MMDIMLLIDVQCTTCLHGNIVGRTLLTVLGAGAGEKCVADCVNVESKGTYEGVDVLLGLIVT